MSALRLTPTWRDCAPIAWPAFMLSVFFVLPFGTMIAVSFFRRDQAAFYTPDFVFDSYARFLTPFFGQVLLFSLLLALLTALICVLVAFPFTWALVRATRRVQVVWLVLLLSVLSLSEVILGFAWSTLFSRTAGLSNIAVLLGLIPEAIPLSPSFGAVLTAMCYQAMPYAVLVLYPTLARIDGSILEAARTLGASPTRAFWQVLIPMCRTALVATVIMVFVFALGSYLLPQILGRPRHWTLSVLITDQAVFQSNLPFAAAMAVFLVLVALSMVALVALIGRQKNA